MWLAVTLLIISISTILSMVMLFSGAGFYITYIPSFTGDGIAQWSPLWILAADIGAVIFLIYRKFLALFFIIAPATVLLMDIYPAWAILGSPDFSLVCHMIQATLFLAALITGILSWKYLDTD